MRIPGVKSAKTFSRWLQARIRGGAVILGYHRIAEETRDAYESCVSPQHFEEQMDMVSRHAHVISLSILVQHLREGSLPARSVAVTFDDGYADNLYLAKPILEKYSIPATVFMCTGYMGREFWWDELERLVMSSNSDPCALRLEAGSTMFCWDVPATASETDPSRNIFMRRKFQQALYRFLLSLDADEQYRSINTIRNWSGLSEVTSSFVRSLTEAELLRLADGGLVEFGAHTRTHPMLPRLSVERQKNEIVSSKQDLEQLLGKLITCFSYPNGRATDVAKRIIQDAGFDYSCTSLQDVVRPGCDLHELTRFWQKDVDGDKFLQGLNLWMGAEGTRQ